MRFLLAPEIEDLQGALAAAAAARDGGLDGLALHPSAALPAPLVTAAAVAAAVPDVLIAARVALGDRHPIELAEEAAVVDHVAGGRLVLIVEPAPEAPALFEEALDLLRTALAPRPFCFRGEHWTVPAGLAQNVHNVEELVRVTPAPPRPQLTIWTAGNTLAVALASALGYAAESEEHERGLIRAFGGTAGERGPAGEHGQALIGVPRARYERLHGPAELIARLRDGRARFGQDWAIVRAPAREARRIGSEVRPHVQLAALPPGLEAHWASAHAQAEP
jgi:alkanesulfonate monooxygenase SsuD/methylene tetrahydromethanopterin reductase-like flavin-dependent oxidoreductase (luciferase family)